MCYISLGAQDLNYKVGITAGTGNSTLAPFYIATMRGGTVTQQHSALLSAQVSHDIDTTRRFSWGAAAELWGGWTSSTEYYRARETSSSGPIGKQNNFFGHAPRFWVQQLYGEVKWRGIFANIGLKRNSAEITNDKLSSGDMTMSANARPMPGITAGFINFQNFPGTRGWLQINGKIGYYKAPDSQWIEDHFNYGYGFITTGYWFSYKNLYLRSNPSKRVVATIGMQASCQFGGYNRTYNSTKITQEIHMDITAKTLLHTIVPNSGGNNPGDVFVEGNHLGSLDAAIDVKLNNGSTLRGYYQSPWEDGSGLGKKNGFDGLWGIEYKSNTPGFVTGALIEYIDLTNQSGPIHFNGNDYGGSTITGQVTGSDDYYNNYTYNGYQNYGMSIGNSLLKSPLYNLDGQIKFTQNLMRGFHLAITGNILPELTYIAKLSYRKSWGSAFWYNIKPLKCTSAMLQLNYHPRRLSALELSLQAALDSGDLYQNLTFNSKRTNFGALLSATYSGNFSFRK